MTETLRAFALRILESADLGEKLRPAGQLVDTEPGSAFRPLLPARPAHLEFCGQRESPPIPHQNTLADPARRAAAHHIMANHELQALEVMAFVLVAFPEAPSEFRMGLARIMADEQRHTKMHLARLDELGLEFGAMLVNGYFWRKAQTFETLLQYLAGLPLTFEGCNLDHTLDFEGWFLEAGDEKSAAVMRAIHRDEIHHVAFGWEWLRKLKPPEQSDWEAYQSNLKWPLQPVKSRGKQFYREPRLAAGLSADFVDKIEHAEVQPKPDGIGPS